MTTKYRLICAECAAEFSAQRAHARYCSRICNRNFNNRRASRGAEAYDFLMGWVNSRVELTRKRDGKKYMDRDPAFLGDLIALTSGWREADKQLRDGRKSFLSRQAAIEALGRLPACSDRR